MRMTTCLSPAFLLAFVEVRFVLVVVFFFVGRLLRSRLLIVVIRRATTTATATALIIHDFVCCLLFLLHLCPSLMLQGKAFVVVEDRLPSLCASLSIRGTRAGS